MIGYERFMETMATSSSFKRRSDIQGLRGLAICLVVLGHLFPEVLPGGYVGVDVFFVISGCLIWQTAASDASTGKFGASHFYRRRAARVLPALAVVVFASSAVGAILLTPEQFAALGRIAAATGLLASNIEAYRQIGYFAGESATKPLLNLWSIGVELQFYTLFPVFFFAVRRLSGRNAILFVFLSCATMCALSQAMVCARPAAAYYLLQSRSFELLLGVLIALAPSADLISPGLRSALSFLALLAIAASAICFGSSTEFPGVAALLPCGGAAVAIWNNDPRGFLYRILSCAPLVWLGTISYSLYLWHWPLLAYSSIWLGPDFRVPEKFFVLAAAIGLSFVTYYRVEAPNLHPRDESGRTWLHMSVLLGALMACGIVIAGAKGFPSRYSARALALDNSRLDFSPWRSACHAGDRAPRPYKFNCHLGYPSRYPDVAVWGDSRGAEIAAILGSRAAVAHRSIMQITASGCPPAIGFSPARHPYCALTNRATLQALTTDARIRTVVLVAAGNSYDDVSTLKSDYADVVKKLARHGKLVVMVGDNPIYRFGVPAFLATRANFGANSAELASMGPRLQDERLADWNEFLVNISRETGAIFIDPARTLCPANRCRMYDPAAGVLYFDGFHLSEAGARLVMSDFEDKIYGSPDQRGD